MLVVGESRGAPQHADIAALVDDPALFARLRHLNFGSAAILGEIGRKGDGLLLRAVAREVWPLGFAIEVDPPLAAGVDDDEDGGSHVAQFPLAPRRTDITARYNWNALLDNMLKVHQALMTK